MRGPGRVSILLVFSIDMDLMSQYNQEYEQYSDFGSDSAGCRGRLTHQTMWYIFGGIASAAVGLLLTIGVIGRSK